MARKKIEIAVDERTEEMPDSALECRSSGHKLPSFRQMLRLDEKTGYYSLEGDCTVCGAHYTEQRTMLGEILKRGGYSYKSAPGYLVNADRYAGTGRVTRSAARAAFIARVFRGKVSAVTLDAPPREGA